MMEFDSDVLIIGGGVTGAAIARLLSGYEIKVCLVEAANDVAMGSSRANSAIVHAGYDAESGSLMAKLNVLGNEMFTKWCEELDVPLLRIGSLVIAFTEADKVVLQELYEKGIQNGVPGLIIIDGDEAKRIESSLSPDVIAALYAPTGGITCPYELTIACCECAQTNGVEIITDAKVVAISQTADGFIVDATNAMITTKYVVNAAGLYADDVARLIGDDTFQIFPRKGEYMMLDRNSTSVNTVIFQTPSELGKGVLVAPTVDGNTFAGPTAKNTNDKSDNEVTSEGLDELMRLSKRSVPSINLRAVITSFAGIRAQPSTGDFIIRSSESNPKLIHAAGICSPGLTSAPAIAVEVAHSLELAGLVFTKKHDAKLTRKAIPHFRHMSFVQRQEAIAQNPLYGRIICRCETVTEAEIVDAINRGANTLDSIKRRTRAGMGRCQGGFCQPRVMEIMARELHVPMESLTKFGGNSKLLLGKLKEDDANA